MKKTLVLFFYLFISFAGYNQTGKTGIAIIPEPVTVIKNAGLFSLPHTVIIETASQPEMNQVTAFLKERLSVPTAIPVTVSHAAPAATIRLLLNKTSDPVIGKEGYHLSVTPKNVLITANQPAGLFYGAQTLIQLFPKEIES